MTNERAILQFDSSFPVGNGEHTLLVSISDWAGNTTTKTLPFSINTGDIAKGYITGTLLDENNNPLEGVQVQIKSGPTSPPSRPGRAARAPGRSRKRSEAKVMARSPAMGSLPPATVARR